MLNFFVTVGAQMPFDRLIKALDGWCENQSACNGIAQVGPDSYKPEHVEWVEFLKPHMYKEYINNADVIISHAGMGSILTALQYGKPIIIFPRLGKLKETRNDHQTATAKRFESFQGIKAVYSESELLLTLDNMHDLIGSFSISPNASKSLIDKIESFISES